MVHKPKHKVHSFRGLLGDGGQDEINLERQNMNLAYRVFKFEIFPWKPGVGVHESTVSVWREKQTSVSTTDLEVDFTDTDLLGAAFFASSGASSLPPPALIVTFDNILFSRNIYLTYTNVEGSHGDFRMNYYIELEEVPVGAATLMQLKLGVARKLDLKEGPYIPPD